MKWHGRVPVTDDFGKTISNTFIDGRTCHGSWAYMTPESHKRHGVGLGEAKGQQYTLQEDGTWLKTAG